uniref:Uncharacterized protein n=1 Tax=Neobodo designis TaxID=312471 RepID=A0A7S1PXZ2_NEODS|mmetsp:Transcript_23956/g.74234  ORF Transcript_23956/g.74234 Transcript_23956/m.74234 type:complete len:154 (+) Transcript_23956:89-550(+)
MTSVADAERDLDRIVKIDDHDLALLRSPRKARDVLERRLTVAREQGDRIGEGKALELLSMVHENLGQDDVAATLLKQSDKIFKPMIKRLTAMQTRGGDAKESPTKRSKPAAKQAKTPAAQKVKKPAAQTKAAKKDAQLPKTGGKKRAPKSSPK